MNEINRKRLTSMYVRVIKVVHSFFFISFLPRDFSQSEVFEQSNRNYNRTVIV